MNKHITSFLLSNKINKRMYSSFKYPAITNIIQNDTTNYKINSDGYRSDDFSKSLEDGKITLFSGCSVTRGSGIDLEYSYAYRVYMHLSQKEKQSGFFNIGINGSTNFESITSIFNFIECYGNPDLIVLTLPPIERDMAFFFDSNIEFETGYRKFRNKEFINMDFTKYTDMFNKVYKILYMYCKNFNIKLITIHWPDSNLKKYKEIYEEVNNFQNFLEKMYPDSYKKISEDEMIEDQYHYTCINKELENLFIARDGMHQGLAWNYALSKQVIERFEI